MHLNDSKTWDLFKNGYTKGIFQLESQLGRSWSKKLEPSNIEELSALISIIRPGVLKAKLEGKSLAKHFVDRKHKREKVVYIDDSIKDILEPTHGILIYQEQAMRIAQKIAGFNLQEADNLRKAIGKKKADLMAKIKTQFIDGCDKVGTVSKETAAEIFSWIEKSSRYSFNKSHGVSYAMNAYHSAWYKANHTKEFFLSCLYYAQEKQDPHQEIYELVSESKLFNINVKLPTIDRYSKNFEIIEGDIYFGIKNIKSLTGVTGDKVIDKIKELEKEFEKPVSDMTWLELLIFLLPKIKSSFKTLSSIGFFCKKGVSRNKALYDINCFSQLSPGEIKWLSNNCYKKTWKNLEEAMLAASVLKKNGGGAHSENRRNVILNEVSLLNNPPFDLKDDPSWIIEQETKILGCPVSLSRVSSSDTSSSNSTCREIIDGKTGNNICIVANIVRINHYKIPEGKSKDKIMCFLSIEDETCVLDNIVVFPDILEENKYVLYEGNNLLFCGKVEKDNSFIIEKIHEI